MSELVRRRDATQQTLEAYRGVAFDPAQGVTCVHLLRDHLVNMGHDYQEIPPFDTMIGAVRALKERGWDNMTDMLDSMLERHRAPAFMRVGDVAVAPGLDGIEAVLICAGPLKVFGWREDVDELAIIDVRLDALVATWRV